MIRIWISRDTRNTQVLIYTNIELKTDRVQLPYLFHIPRMCQVVHTLWRWLGKRKVFTIITITKPVDQMWSSLVRRSILVQCQPLFEQPKPKGRFDDFRPGDPVEFKGWTNGIITVTVMLCCSYLVLYAVIRLGVTSCIKWKVFIYNSYGVEGSRRVLWSR